MSDKKTPAATTSDLPVMAQCPWPECRQPPFLIDYTARPARDGRVEAYVCCVNHIDEHNIAGPSRDTAHEAIIAWNSRAIRGTDDLPR